MDEVNMIELTEDAVEEILALYKARLQTFYAGMTGREYPLDLEYVIQTMGFWEKSLEIHRNVVMAQIHDRLEKIPIHTYIRNKCVKVLEEFDE